MQDPSHGINRRHLILAAASAGTLAALPGCGGSDDTAPAAGPTVTKRSVTVSDGVKLSYLEAGSGKTLVLIPGWSQTAEQFKFQLDGLASRYRVIALDMRGHGDSDKPAYGYRIERLAKDVHDAMVALGLDDVTVLGHSMGCSVLWCHFELFGPERIGKYVFCDQASFLTSNPNWSAQQIADYGPLFTPASVNATANALAGPDGAATTETFLRAMVTASIPADQFQWILDLNLKTPRAHAATLLYNHCQQDWRDVLPHLSRPSLFIGGKASLVPYTCVSWNASQVAGSQLQIFETADKGSHFMFIENPNKFNGILQGFIG